MDIWGLLICLAPAALAIVLFGGDYYLETHPEFIVELKKRLGRQ